MAFRSLGAYTGIDQVFMDLRRGIEGAKLNTALSVILHRFQVAVQNKLSNTYLHKPPTWLEQHTTFRVGDIPGGIEGLLEVEGDYSIIREHGGTIVSTGKYMTIPLPLPDAMSERNIAQRYMGTDTFLKYVGNNRFLVLDSNTKQVLYMLARSVPHPAQPYIEPSLKDEVDRINQEVGDQVIALLLGDTKSEYLVSITVGGGPQVAAKLK